jgi:hypothetical protein
VTGPAWVEGGAEGWAVPAATTGHSESDMETVAAALWQPTMEWLAGKSRTIYKRSASELEALTADLMQTAPEAEPARVTAAGALAHTNNDLGLAPLVAAAQGEAESVHRAACYGLAAAGDGATSSIIAMLGKHPLLHSHRSLL